MTATTDRAALYRGILERPEDDVARLVYADWLEENGGTVSCPVCPPDEGEEPHPADIICDRCHGSRTVSDGQREHARFIRDCVWMHANHTDCPVRLADVKRGRPVPLRCGSCEYCTARRRAEKFYSGHPWLSGINYAVCFEPSPLDGPMPTGPRLTLTVSRGFVSAVTCRLADWVGTTEYAEMSTHSSPAVSRVLVAMNGGHGPRIVAEQPVERVEVTDADSCIVGYGDGMPDDYRFGVSIPVLSDASLPWPEKMFGTREEAVEYLDDLSDRLVNWARREVGLPPLREHATA